MANAKVFRDETVLSLDQIVVVVLRERGTQAVGRPARLAVPDGVRQYHEILAGIQGLARTEQFTAERWRKHGRTGLSGAMQDENRLARRCPYRLIVNPKLGQDLAGAKPEIADRPITLLGRGKVRSACNDGGHGNSSDKDESHKGSKSHLVTSSYADAYWTLAQLVAHHTVNGCNLRDGDLFGSGTLSGPKPEQAGSLLEMTQGGKQPIAFSNGETRGYLEDGDTIVLKGYCQRHGFRRIGFCECRGTVQAARQVQASRCRSTWRPVSIEVWPRRAWIGSGRRTHHRSVDIRGLPPHTLPNRERRRTPLTSALWSSFCRPDWRLRVDSWSTRTRPRCHRPGDRTATSISRRPGPSRPARTRRCGPLRVP